jgi:hypothetical protein
MVIISLPGHPYHIIDFSFTFSILIIELLDDEEKDTKRDEVAEKS